MKIKSNFHPDYRNRAGALIVFILFLLVIVIAGAAFCVDIAYMHMVRAELRTATDSAARAGAESLARTQNPDTARQAAIDAAAQNNVAGHGLQLSANEILIGNSTPGANGELLFVPNQSPLNSVQILSDRGDVKLFIGGLLGTETFAPKMDATASATVRDIALVLDRSGSMGQLSGSTTRLQALQSAVSIFINDVQEFSPGSNLSLTTYSTNASRDLPLTSNMGQVLGEVANLEPEGATNIFEALRFGSDSLEQDPLARPHAERTIVLMTDGNFNEGGTPIPSALLAKSRGHTIHTITFSAEADQVTMQEVATVADGIHIHADNNSDLRNAFREIAKTLAVVLTK